MLPYVGYMQLPAAARIGLGTRTSARGGKRRRSKKRAKVRARSRRSSGKKSGRKMKFGSPAWQKKYRVGKYAKKR